MSINLNDIALLKIRDVDYRCIINGIDKSEAVSLQKYVDLTEEKEILSK